MYNYHNKLKLSLFHTFNRNNYFVIIKNSFSEILKHRYKSNSD